MDTDKRESQLIARILAIEQQIKARHACEKLTRYNQSKVHEKQIVFHKCIKRNRWVFGGNRTGKTECGAVETVWRARGVHPYRENRPDTRGWVVSVSREVQREVAQAKILDYLDPAWIVDITMESGRATNPRGGVIDTVSIRNVFGGVSTIGFKTYEMGRDKFQGASLDYVWFDEEPPEDVYDECRMRVVDRVGDLYGTMTPLKGLTFVYRKIFLNEDDDPEIWHETMEWRDNPFLDPDEIERLSRTLEQDVLSARRFGKFSSSEGLVYPEFDPSIHVVEPFDIPFGWQDKLSIDPGLNNPLSCHWYAVDGDGTIFVVAEHYEAGRDASYHIDAIKRISAALGWHTDSRGRIEALIDAAATQRTLAAEKSVAQLFFEGGIAVNPHVDKQLFAGINRVKAQLKGDDGRPKLYIFSCCKNLIRELKSYFWNGDVPKKKDDHALDELRYYIMSRPQPYVPPAAARSELKRFKDRLIRKTGYRLRRSAP